MPTLSQIEKLRNPVRNYAWGSYSAIAEFQGRPSPTSQPEAEVWIGAHPAAPSSLARGSELESLVEVLERDAVDILGPAIFSRHGNALPFLVKLLAAANPLSIQVHPTAAEARAGFEREESLGLPIDAPNRCYRDANEKHETLIALDDFQLLCGFRPDEEVDRWIDRVGGPLLSAEYDAARNAQSESEAESESDRATAAAAAPGRNASSLLLHLLRLDAPEQSALFDELDRFGNSDAPPSEPAHWVARLCEHHRGDVAVAAPLLLNLLCLARNDALIVRPGTIHSYLQGFGVEIMTCSDNVVRGGLTTKHRDLTELERLVDPEAAIPHTGGPRLANAGQSTYATGNADYGVTVWTLAESDPPVACTSPGAQIALCVEGRVELVDGLRNRTVELSRGEAALIPARVQDYQIGGGATLLLVAVP